MYVAILHEHFQLIYACKSLVTYMATVLGSLFLYLKQIISTPLCICMGMQCSIFMVSCVITYVKIK